MYEFSSYRKLNIKKVIIASLIAILLIVSVTVFIISKTGNHSVENSNIVNSSEGAESKTEVFKDIDETVSIEIPKKYKLTQSHNSEYLIKLSSDDNLYVYVSKMEKMENRPLSSVARADRLSYLEEYNAYSNLSELKELNVNGNPAYIYSFHYLDENLRKAFYIQVVLMELDDAIYVFDVDFPLDDLSLYTNLVTEVLEKFVKH